MNRFNVITPVCNAETQIAETIESVLKQSIFSRGGAQLNYWIIDGASTDRTLEVVKSFPHPSIHVISEKDLGLYDALTKGLEQIQSGICCYINAGDSYSDHAFKIVDEILRVKKIKWLTGLNVVYNEQSQFISSSLPFKYRKRLFQCGIYGKYLPYIQQESTFWDASLNKLLDLQKLRSFKLAGDFYMWHEFSKAEPLTIVEAYLGGFKVHAGQLSKTKSTTYASEIKTLTKRPTPADLGLILLDRLFWYAPPKVKKWFNPNFLLRYNHAENRWV